MRKVLKNSARTPKKKILDQMNEKRPLPMGRKEFDEWSERIISGALLPGGKDDPEAFIDEQKRVLCGMILHCGPTESHKEDAFFIHSLRKNASNFTAQEMFTELQAKAKERVAKRLEKEQPDDNEEFIAIKDLEMKEGRLVRKEKCAE